MAEQNQIVLDRNKGVGADRESQRENLAFVHTSLELYPIYVLAMEGKISPSTTSIVLTFDFEFDSLDPDVKLSRTELVRALKNMGFEVWRTSFLSNRIAMSYWKYEFETQQKGRFRSLFYKCLSWSQSFDRRRLRNLSACKKMIVSHPSLPLSQLILQVRADDQEVVLYPHGLWSNAQRMKEMGEHFGMPFLACDSKVPIQEFFGRHLLHRMNLVKQIENWPTESVLICLEYVQPIMRKDEYIELYVRFIERLKCLGYSSFLLKFHPRSAHGDNQYFIRKLKSKIEAGLHLGIVDTCLDLELWVNVCSGKLLGKVAAAAAISSSAAEIFAENLNAKAFYAKDLGEELASLNPAPADGLQRWTPPSDNIIYV